MSFMPAGTSCALLTAISLGLSSHVPGTVRAQCLTTEFIHQMLSGAPPPHIPETSPWLGNVTEERCSGSPVAHNSAGCAVSWLEHCPNTQHCKFILRSGLIQESVKECINRWNTKLMSLSYSLSQINTFFKNLFKNSQ